MGKLIKPVAVGLVLFAASAAGSLALQKSGPEADEAETSADDGTLETADSGEPVTVEDSGNRPAQSTNVAPVVAHPQPVSPEELVQMSVTIRERERMLKLREDAIRQEEDHARLMFEDIRSEQDGLNALQTQIDTRLQLVEKLLDDMTREKAAIQSERKAADEAKAAAEKAGEAQDEATAANIKDISEWVQGMEPGAAAETLKGMSNDGNMDTVFRLLRNFEPRDAAEILSAIDDKDLVVQILTRFSESTPEKKKNPKGRR